MLIDTLEQRASSADAGLLRPLNLRPRKDLIVAEQISARQKFHVVKDPLSMEYFHFGEQEWFVLECLREPVSLSEIQRRFRKQFPPLQIQVEELKVFLARVIRDNLVVMEGKLGLGDSFLEQAGQKAKAGKSFRWTRILYIRFRGIDPNGILSVLQPIGKVIFHPLFMAAAGLAMCLTIAFIIVQFDQVSSRLPETIDLFTPQNLLLMMLVIGVVKVFHELGHGLACQQLGGECREMGVLLLAFVPCLYCNVSDTWLETRKSRRLMVSVAGIYVELLLAVLCFSLWYASYPGTLNSICLNVVLICSINTVFINGNPLLRYDGYFMLADFVDVPNLAQQARAVLARKIRGLLVLTSGPGVPGSRRDVWLSIYAVASMAYRVFVIGAIVFGIHLITKANDVEIIGNVAIIIALFGVLLPLLYQVRRTVHMEFRSMKFKPVSAFMVFSLSVGIITLLCLVPFPHEIKAPAVVELRDPTVLFAPHGGRLEWMVDEGAVVGEGQVIAQIDNVELQELCGQLETAINEKSTRVDNLQIRAKNELEQIPELPVLQTELRELEKQLDALTSEIRQLELKSPHCGVVFPVPPRSGQLDSQMALNPLPGSLLDPVNSGSFVERGQPLCLIGNPEDLKAAVYLDEDWVEEVAEGTDVRFCFDHSRHTIVDGTVVNLVGESVEQLPESVVTNRMMSVAKDNSGLVTPAQPVFRIECQLKGTLPVILPGSTGTAKVRIQDKTVMQRVGRFINRTFRMDW